MRWPRLARPLLAGLLLSLEFVGKASRAESDLALLDLTSSAPIAPGTSFSLSPQLPASFQVVLGGTPQTVQLLGATINVSTQPLSDGNGIEYHPFAITSAQGSFGAVVLNGAPCLDVTFVLAAPGTGRINYSSGAIFVELELRFTAAGCSPMNAFAYTSGVLLSPTTVRLLNGGDILEIPNTPDAPALSTLGLLVLAVSLLAAFVVRQRTLLRAKNSGSLALLILVAFLTAMNTSCKKKTILREETGIPDSNVVLSGNVLAQSFAARVDFTLDKIKVRLDECQGSVSTQVDLYVQDGPELSANILATASAFASSVPYDLEFAPLDPLTLERISIPKGQFRYIRLDGSAGQCSWGMDTTAFYQYGAAYQNGMAVPPSGDFCMKVYSVEEIRSPSH